jgi:hypothetical protein
MPNTPDTSLSFIPTAEWQTRLSERLAASGALSKPLNAKGSCPTFDPSGTPLVRRRRLDLSPEDTDCNQPNWNEMYTMDDGSTDGGVINVFAVDSRSSVSRRR